MARQPGFFDTDERLRSFLIGGVGGTITLAAYGYWLREKGWYTPKWMKVMRIDNTVAYVVVLGLLWVMVRTGFLFRFVPR